MNALSKDLPNRIKKYSFGDLLSKNGDKNIILVKESKLQDVVNSCIYLTGNLQEQFMAMMFDGKVKFVLPNLKKIPKTNRKYFLTYKDIPMNQQCNVLEFPPIYYVELKGKNDK